MHPRLLITADGSHTLLADEAGSEIYHSRHGALAESSYVFIRQGLEDALNRHNIQKNSPKALRILEVGFGTGLNALLTVKHANALGVHIEYTGLEPHPVEAQVLEEVNYPELLQIERARFLSLHAPGGYNDGLVHLHIVKETLEAYTCEDSAYDLIYFDAFSPRYQEEMWHTDTFARLFSYLVEGGTLVTYSAKGEVQRQLKGLGFLIEKLPGPPGKREMIRALKPTHYAH